ncbi:MAG: N-6 DNA methylase [Nanoarchaeota archaeon]
MTKKEFIEPLFEALGWDIRNQNNEDEVLVERQILRGRVDYAFQLGGIPQFFLEAKSLKEDLDNPRFIQQAIDYAWHKSCTWAILTDFEAIKIFNAEWKSSNPLQAQVGQTLPCQMYLERFDQLWMISKESFKTKLLDSEAERWGKKVKKSPVDKQLLADLTRFRELLTKNIYKNNESRNLSVEDLDETVQRLIDRLIFIRTLEDKELEAKILEPIIRGRGTKKIYVHLKEEFKRMDELYNSKLFSNHLLDQDLVIDDDTLEKVITGLFRTADDVIHYDFAAIDADVLGNIYEQYLGHILKKTEKRARLTEGKAHRKEQGIYYTPTYIVDFIVKNTIGELAKDKKFDLTNIKVLDPACGSGSFLMKSFDYLVTLDKKRNADIDQTKLDLTGASATYGRKVEILKKNIFGVDLDPRAVEIAQLNLLLKAMEKRARLPLLQENIKVGNSLIDDFQIEGTRAFKWEEQFKEIMDKGGFDVVIGNPPWLMAGYCHSSKQIEYLHKKYDSAKGKFDLYYCFVELAIRLIRNKGFFGMIIPNKFFHTKSAKGLREVIINSGRLYHIIDFGDEKVFGDATNYSSILLLKSGNHKKVLYTEVDAKIGIRRQIKLDVDSLSSDAWYFEDNNEKMLFDKMKKVGIPLVQIAERFGTGVQTGADKLYFRTEEEAKNIGARITCNILRGRDVRRYSVSRTAKQAIFPYEIVNDKFKILDEDEVKKCGEVWQVLESNRANLSKRIWFGKNATQLSGKFYGYMYLDGYLNFKKPHILTPSLSDKSNFAMGTGDLFVTGTAGVTSIILKRIPEDIKYILGLLNSKLVSSYVLRHSPIFQGGYHKFSSNYLKQIPIKRINMDDVSETERYVRIIKTVENIITCKKQLTDIGDKQTEKRFRLETEIQKLDTEIDQEVYKLYSLTDEEIQIAEKTTK